MVKDAFALLQTNIYTKQIPYVPLSATNHSKTEKLSSLTSKLIKAELCSRKDKQSPVLRGLCGDRAIAVCVCGFNILYFQFI